MEIGQFDLCSWLHLQLGQKTDQTRAAKFDKVHHFTRRLFPGVVNPRDANINSR